MRSSPRSSWPAAIALAAVPERVCRFFRLVGGDRFGDTPAGLPRSQLAILPGTSHVTAAYRADLLLAIIPPFLDAHTHVPQHPIRGRFMDGITNHPPEGRLLDASAGFLLILGVESLEDAARLEAEGVQKFADSFEELLEGIRAKRSELAEWTCTPIP